MSETDTDENGITKSPTSVDDMVQRRLKSLSAFAQNLLQVSACIGNEIDELVLTAVLDGQTEEIAKSIKAAAEQEFLVYEPRCGRYRFVHDRIKQAAYSMIEDADKLSFEIGFKLWQRLAPMYMDAKIFTIVNLMNRDVNQLNDKPDRLKAAALNLEAGVKAVSLAAYPDASRYIAAGIAFLEGTDHWKVDYQLSLKLFSTAADAELCNQNFDRVKELAAEVYEHARTPQDKLAAYAAHINAVGQSGSVHEALNIGLDALRELGEKVESPITPQVIGNDIHKTMAAVRGKSNQDLMALRSMTDRDKLAAVHLWNLLLPYAFQSGSPITVLCGTRVVRLCREFGMAKACAIGFATLAWVLCETNRQEGYRFGQLALSIIGKARARELIPRVHLPYYYFTHHWIRPLRETLEPLKNSCKVAIEVGDMEYAAYASNSIFTNSLYSGMKLKMVESILNDVAIQMRTYRQDNTLKHTQWPRQYIHNLTGRASNPKVLIAHDINDNNEGVTVLSLKYALAADLAYMFDDFELAEKLVSARLSLHFDFHALYENALNTVRDGLIAVARARQGVDRRKNVKAAKIALKKMTAWSKDCPENFLNKQNLLDAELKSLSSGKRIDNKIAALYDQAIQQALEQGFLPEAARAAERAGDYMHRQRSDERAVGYWKRARDIYFEWGATTKAQDLKVKLSSAMTLK